MMISLNPKNEIQKANQAQSIGSKLIGKISPDRFRCAFDFSKGYPLQHLVESWPFPFRFSG